jgi:hypothetical protein
MEGIGLPLGLFMSFVGTAQKVSAAQEKERDALATGERNALSQEESAAFAVARSALPGSRARMQGSQIAGEARTQVGATGVDVNVGSPQQLAAQTRVFSDLDEQIIRNNSMVEAYGYRVKANLFRQDAQERAAAARNEATAAIIGGVAGVIGGPLGKAAVDSLGGGGGSEKPVSVNPGANESEGYDLRKPVSVNPGANESEGYDLRKSVATTAAAEAAGLVGEGQKATEELGLVKRAKVRVTVDDLLPRRRKVIIPPAPYAARQTRVEGWLLPGMTITDMNGEP